MTARRRCANGRQFACHLLLRIERARSERFGNGRQVKGAATAANGDTLS